jgi:hypothetical protein
LARQYTLRDSRPEKPARRSVAHRHGFSPRQQAVYRRIVEDAWKAASHDVKDQVAKERWYREVLHEKLGVFTSKQLNKSGDFERACAAFEEIAGNSIYWQLRVNAAPLERMRLKLRAIVREHDIEEEYIAGVSRQMFDTHPSNLKPEQLNKLIAALEIHFKRQEAA